MVLECQCPIQSSRRARDDFLQLHHLFIGEVQQRSGARVHHEYSRGNRLWSLFPSLNEVFIVGFSGCKVLHNCEGMRGNVHLDGGSLGVLLVWIPATGGFRGVWLKNTMPIRRKDISAGCIPQNPTWRHGLVAGKRILAHVVVVITGCLGGCCGAWRIPWPNS